MAARWTEDAASRPALLASTSHRINAALVSLKINRKEHCVPLFDVLSTSVSFCALSFNVAFKCAHDASFVFLYRKKKHLGVVLFHVLCMRIPVVCNMHENTYGV